MGSFKKKPSPTLVKANQAATDKKYELALKLILKLEADEMNTDAAQNILGVALWKLNRFQEASFTFQKLVASNPASVEALQNYESVQVAMKVHALKTANTIRSDGEQSIEAATKTAKLYEAIDLNDPCSEEVRFHILYNAGLCHRADNLAAASQSIEAALELRPTLADGYKNLGLVRRALKDYDGAIVAFERAMQNIKNDDDPELLKVTRRSLVEVSFLAGRYDIVLSEVDSLIPKDDTEEKTSDKALAAKAFFWRGLALLRTGDEFQASFDLTKSLSLFYRLDSTVPLLLRSSLFMACAKCSETLIRRESFKEALPYLDGAISLIDKHPMYEKVALNRGILMAMFNERRDEAVNDLETLAHAQIDPKNIMRLQLVLGMLYMDLGRYTEAEELLVDAKMDETFLSLPTATDFIFDWGICCFKSEHLYSAREAFKLVLENQPDHEAAESRLQYIERLIVAHAKKNDAEFKKLKTRTDTLFAITYNFDGLKDNSSITPLVEELQKQLAWAMTKVVDVKEATVITKCDPAAVVDVLEEVESSACEVSDAITTAKIDTTEKLCEHITSEVQRIESAKVSAETCLIAARDALQDRSDMIIDALVSTTDALDALEIAQARAIKIITTTVNQMNEVKIESVSKVRELIRAFDKAYEAACTRIEDVVEEKRVDAESKAERLSQDEGFDLNGTISALKCQLQQSNHINAVIEKKLARSGLEDMTEVSDAQRLSKTTSLMLDTAVTTGKFEKDSILLKIAEAESATRYAAEAVDSACRERRTTDVIHQLEARISAMDIAQRVESAFEAKVADDKGFIDALAAANQARSKAIMAIEAIFEGAAHSESVSAAHLAVDEAMIRMLALDDAIVLIGEATNMRHAKNLLKGETSPATQTDAEIESSIDDASEQFGNTRTEKKFQSLLMSASEESKADLRLPFDEVKTFGLEDSTETEELYNAGWSLSALKILEKRRSSSFIANGTAITLSEIARGREPLEIDEVDAVALYELGWSPSALQVLLELRAKNSIRVSLSLCALAEEYQEMFGPEDGPRRRFDYSKTFMLDQLLESAKLPQEVDPSRRELHLNDNDFEKLFGLDKAAFFSLPKWKQIMQKKEHQLY